MKKNGFQLMVWEDMPRDEAMICTREALEKGARLEDLVEARLLTESEAKEDLELWLYREIEAGRTPAVLVTNIGQEAP